jgi:hypothetical protein
MSDLYYLLIVAVLYSSAHVLAVGIARLEEPRRAK